jgi:hypothetical protein
MNPSVRFNGRNNVLHIHNYDHLIALVAIARLSIMVCVQIERQQALARRRKAQAENDAHMVKRTQEKMLLEMQQAA